METAHTGTAETFTEGAASSGQHAAQVSQGQQSDGDKGNTSRGGERLAGSSACFFKKMKTRGFLMLFKKMTGVDS